MQSPARFELLELPEPTAADNAALERVRVLNAMDPHEYLAFLLAFAPQHPPSRDVTVWPEPFEL